MYLGYGDDLRVSICISTFFSPFPSTIYSYLDSIIISNGSSCLHYFQPWQGVKGKKKKKNREKTKPPNESHKQTCPARSQRLGELIVHSCE